MKQILQSLSTGETVLADVPCPGNKPGSLLIASRRTLVSAGTERMLVDFGKGNLIAKARQQPDKVRMVLDKVRTDGLLPTLEAVRDKLDQPLAMGYCNVGVVTQLSHGVSSFAVGDRVASNGKHAEMVSVPANLCARIPDDVDDEAAAFTVLGAIALQGVRLAAPTLGEAVVVTGLGLVGLLTVQLLRANGCRVLGLDVDPARLELGRRFGAEVVDVGAGADPIAASDVFSRGRGVDAVIVTAATQSSEPIHQAALMSRQRGRIVLVGVTGLELSRDDFFKKELTFQVSASYGPGRYDPSYEEKGHDYPFGFVRWTAQRNFEAVLDLLAERRLDVAPLISHRFAVAEAKAAYDLVAGAEPSLGILLEYPEDPAPAGRTVSLADVVPVTPSSDGVATVSFVGSGNYATRTLIPAFKEAGARLRFVASSAGVSSVHAGGKFGFEKATTDVASVLADAATDAVVISTRHDSHADLVVAGLESSKHVFVEKPLCLTLEELSRIEAAWRQAEGRLLMVGFNRRFAPHVQRIRALLEGVSGPRAFVMTVNAGSIPLDHWTQDPEIGGGRVIGEACHFVDLLRFLAGAPIDGFSSTRMDSATDDTVIVSLRFADGSIGSVQYFANGSKSFPKERLEVFTAGRVLQLDNFRKLTGYGWPGFSRALVWRQDKGQRECSAAFVRAVKEGGSAPIPADELFEVSRVTIQIAQSLRG